jgi:hypothetical protein
MGGQVDREWDGRRTWFYLAVEPSEDHPTEAERRAFLGAFVAYLDDPSDEHKAAILAAAPEQEGPWLLNFINLIEGWPAPSMVQKIRQAYDRLLASPSPAPALAPAPSRTPARAPARRRPPPRRVLVGSSAAVIVVAAVVTLVAVLGNAFSGQSPSMVTNLPATPAAWRLAGFIDQPAWQTDPATTVGSAAVVTCPSASTCYADVMGGSPADTVAEASTDGGTSWQGSALPTGWQFTSALSCPTAGQCLAGGSAPGAAVLSTADGGTTWSASVLPAAVAQVTNLACNGPSVCVGTGYGPAAPGTTAGPSVAVVTGDGGSSWTTAALPGPFVSDNPEGLACPTAQSCVAVGATSFSTSTATGAARYSMDGGVSWSPAVVPADVARLRAVACASAAECVALGNADSPFGPTEALTSTNGGQSWSVAGPVGPTPAVLSSISCPTVTECWAAGTLATSESGTVVATDDGGTTWAVASLPTKLSPAEQGATGLPELDVQSVSSISCPTAGTCVALGTERTLAPAERKIVLRTDGSKRTTADGREQTVSQRPGAGPGGAGGCLR